MADFPSDTGSSVHRSSENTQQCHEPGVQSPGSSPGDFVDAFADVLGARPVRRWDYREPARCFDSFLDMKQAGYVWVARVHGIDCPAPQLLPAGRRLLFAPHGFPGFIDFLVDKSIDKRFVSKKGIQICDQRFIEVPMPVLAVPASSLDFHRRLSVVQELNLRKMGATPRDLCALDQGDEEAMKHWQRVRFDRVRGLLPSSIANELQLREEADWFRTGFAALSCPDPGRASVALIVDWSMSAEKIAQWIERRLHMSREIHEDIKDDWSEYEGRTLRHIARVIRRSFSDLNDLRIPMASRTMLKWAFLLPDAMIWRGRIEDGVTHGMMRANAHGRYDCPFDASDLQDFKRGGGTAGKAMMMAQKALLIRNWRAANQNHRGVQAPDCRSGFGKDRPGLASEA